MNTPHATPRRARRFLRGLTLVELLVAIALVAVLLGLAAPSMAAILNQTRLTAATNTFLASLRLARSEAVRRGGRVTLCKSTDGKACAAAGGWEQGWIVFHDSDGDGVVDPGEFMIQQTEAQDPGMVITGNASVARAIVFTATGRNRTAAGGMQAGTLTLCNKADAGGPARQIVIASGGRTRVRNLAHCTG